MGEGNETTGKENDTTRNGDDDEGGEWNDDTAGRPSTSTGRRRSQGRGHPPPLRAPARRVDGGVLMPRGEETKGREGVGQTPPREPTFARGFLLFNYSYRLPPSHDEGRGDLYYVGCPTLPHPS